MDRAGDRELLLGACRRGVPPLPSPAMRLALELAADEQSNDDRLIEQLESDARLAFGVLAGANLRLLGSSRPVKTVRQAVANLGRRKCLALLWIVALSDFLQSWPHLAERARLKLWRHSLLTAVLAHELHSAAGVTGDALAAGMAHDIGHLLVSGPGARLGIVWHEEHELIVEKRDLSPAPERDHCRLGASLRARVRNRLMISPARTAWAEICCKAPRTSSRSASGSRNKRSHA